MRQQAVVSLDALRERIREIEGHRVRQRRSPSGVDSLDRLIDGLPLPGILEIAGLPGAGRLRIAAPITAAWTRRGQPVVWVDPTRRLNPAALIAWGVDLAKLLVVRPGVDREAWAVEQLARSGCFPVVVVVDPTIAKPALGQRWAHAAEAGSCCVVVLAHRPQRQLPATVRTLVERGRLRVTRDRSGLLGGAAELPGWPEGADPWR